MSTARVIRLDSREAVERAVTTRFLLRVFLPRLEIALPALDAEATRELQARVDRLVDACGCGEGAAATLIALGIYLTYAATIGPERGVMGIIGSSLLAMFIGATIGKVTGLLRARFELRRVLTSLGGRLGNVASPPSAFRHVNQISR